MEEIKELTDNEIQITLEDFKLIKSFYSEFDRKQGINTNKFVIGWSEIMPVVEKIHKMWGQEIIYPCTYWHRINKLEIWMPISVVYEKVVDFISWYINQKDKT